MTRPVWVAGVGVLVVAGVTTVWLIRRVPPVRPAGPVSPAANVAAADGLMRFQGTVEATRARTVLVPRLAGQTAPTLVITHLVDAGAHVNTGDVIVEFDRQEQLRIARDRQADLVDLDGQIEKKKSDQAIAEAADQTALQAAGGDVSRAELDVRTNDLVSKVQAEKNTLALEQAQAQYTQLRSTYDLKRRAAAADLKILQIQRARAEQALQYAQSNAALMSVTAPFSGLVVLKQVWKGDSQAPVGEGEEVRPGLAILDIVDSSAMQVRTLINQADIGLVAPGQPARVRLDAYPQLVFNGRFETIAPLGVSSGLTPKVHSFTAIVSIDGTDPELMPDLTASVEIAPPAAAPAASAPAAAPGQTGGH